MIIPVTYPLFIRNDWRHTTLCILLRLPICLNLAGFRAQLHVHRQHDSDVYSTDRMIMTIFDWTWHMVYHVVMICSYNCTAIHVLAHMWSHASTCTQWSCNTFATDISWCTMWAVRSTSSTKCNRHWSMHVSGVPKHHNVCSRVNWFTESYNSQCITHLAARFIGRRTNTSIVAYINRSPHTPCQTYSEYISST